MVTVHCLFHVYSMLFSKYCPGVTTLGVTFFLSLSLLVPKILRILGQGRFSPAMFFFYTNKKVQGVRQRSKQKNNKKKLMSSKYTEMLSRCRVGTGRLG